MGISESKFGATYQEEINNLHVAPDDMERLGISVGDRVRVISDHGEIEILQLPRDPPDPAP